MSVTHNNTSPVVTQ